MGACVVRPGVPVEQAWEGSHAVAAAGTATQGPLRSSPALGWSLSLFFFFIIGQARFSDLWFPPLPNPEGRSRWPLWFGLHSAHQHASSFSIPATASAASQWGESWGTEFCLGSHLLLHCSLGLASSLESLLEASRRRGKKRVLGGR